MKSKLFFLFSLPIIFLSCKKEKVKFDPLDTGYAIHLSFDGNVYDELNGLLVTNKCDSLIFEPGVQEEGITLGGDCSYIIFDKETFRTDNHISVSFWFKTKHLSGIHHFIRCNDFIVSSNVDRMAMLISIPNTENASGKFASDEWTHFVGTYDGNNIKAYVNGKLVETTKHSGVISSPGYPLILGGQGWQGSIDELYIYDAVLNSQQVKLLYEM